jgi:predicted enzyme related to lactoylglutathione lyase
MAEQTEQVEQQERVLRDGYPEGVTCWVDVELPDPEAAIDFYSGIFGWKLTEQMPDETQGSYLEATIDGHRVAALGSRPDNAGGPPAWNTYVCVKSADKTAEQIKAVGGTILAEPFDVMKAGRMAIASDPQGASFRLWEPGEHRGAQLVNEYGCWVFSDLTTGDVDAAGKFYGSVFGWETGGGDGWTFFTVPGYGDHLEKLIPGLREKASAQDAPEGFVDVTASVRSMEGMPEGTSPSWGVTFGVEDADETAAKAEELGGKVLVAPFDAPPVRTAVISDPQGAVFAVSRYYPPNE